MKNKVNKCVAPSSVEANLATLLPVCISICDVVNRALSGKTFQIAWNSANSHTNWSPNDNWFLLTIWLLCPASVPIEIAAHLFSLVFFVFFFFKLIVCLVGQRVRIPISSFSDCQYSEDEKESCLFSLLRTFSATRIF